MAEPGEKNRLILYEIRFMEKEKRRLTRIEWVLIIIVGLILLSLVLERLGVPIVSTSEDSELIQRPHQ